MLPPWYPTPLIWPCKHRNKIVLNPVSFRTHRIRLGAFKPQYCITNRDRIGDSWMRYLIRHYSWVVLGVDSLTDQTINQGFSRDATTKSCPNQRIKNLVRPSRARARQLQGLRAREPKLSSSVCFLEFKALGRLSSLPWGSPLLFRGSNLRSYRTFFNR